MTAAVLGRCMHLKPFAKLLKELETLSDPQKSLAVDVLTQPKNLILNRLNQQIAKKPDCPHCHDKHIVKFGKANGRQRYQCKGCSRTFVCTRGSAFFYQHHKEKWLPYLTLMLRSEKLKGCARDCGISMKTSFNWRHRYMKEPESAEFTRLEGIVEADETFFRHSDKGAKNLIRKARKRGTPASTSGINYRDWIAVLVALDRSHHEFDCILQPVNAKNIKSALKDKLAKDAVLCTDGQPAYNSLCDHLNIEHIVLNQTRTQGSYHIQHVNAYHQRLKSWHRGFHGVASKYLTRYLGWFRMLEWHKYEEAENPLDFRLLALQQHKK